MSARLPAAFRGQVIGPDHPGYDAARALWKGVDHRPALIARCADVADVRRVVEYAAAGRLPLAVAGTGHDVAGRSVPTGALVLATGALDQVAIDPVRRLARVGAGVRWGELVVAAGGYGLATTGASVASVGVTGFVLHGGLGWLMRSLGAGCDNIEAVELVTADGRLRTVDAERDPELLWALRGAGSNFGVVTALTLRLHPVERVVAGVRVYPASLARPVLAAYRQLTAGAPDELVTHFYYRGGPEGVHTVGVGLCLGGPPERLDTLLAPLAPLGRPLLDSVAERDAVGLQAVHESSTPPGGRYHLRGHYLGELTDAAIDAVLGHCRSLTGPLTGLFLEHLGGAVGRGSEADACFAGRHARYSLMLASGWTDPAADAEQRAWTRAFGDAVRPHALPGGYPNYLDEDEDHRIPAAYGAGYRRLRVLKRRHDPDNLFRFNRNIPPEATDEAR